MKISVSSLILYKFLTLISPDKIKQVRKQLNGGEPEGEIRNKLSAEGYNKEEIDQCFPAHKADMRTWYLIFGILFLCIGIWTEMESVISGRLLGGLIPLALSGYFFFRYYKDFNKISVSK